MVLPMHSWHLQLQSVTVMATTFRLIHFQKASPRTTGRPQGNSAQARYRRTRHLNNVASRRCRAKRRMTAAMEQQELDQLQDRNVELRQETQKLELAVEKMRNLVLAHVPNAAEIYKFRMMTSV